MGEVTLIIEEEEFTIKKEVLCEYSDYFRAMFSGNYVENEKEQVKINVVDASSMKIIIGYMEDGFIDLTNFSLSMISVLAASANFLQITELLKQIEFTLDLKLSLLNWMPIMTIAEASSFVKLEKCSAAFGLISFKEMQPEYIPSIHRLFWYLSHPHLNTENELSVFKFGLEWVSKLKRSADAILIILGCLDISALTVPELDEMKKCMKEYEFSLASCIVNCLHEIFLRYWEISSSDISKHRKVLCELFTERVYNEVVSLVRGSTKRQLNLVPCTSICPTKESKEKGPQHLYTFMAGVGFEEFLEVAQQNLWGWSITSWGPHKLVVAGGEYGRGTGVFMREVLVWDTLRKEWTRHGVELAPRRHAGLTVIGNQLYMVGGVGTYRVVLSSVHVYDLEERSFRKLKELPDSVQNPPVCSHEGKLYVGCQQNIYRYIESGALEYWEKIVDTHVRPNYLISFGKYIYVTQACFNLLLRFRPDVDQYLALHKSFVNPVAAMCNVGKSIIAFTQKMYPSDEDLTVEEYVDGEIKKTRVLWTEKHSSLNINGVAGCCSLIMAMPPLNPMVSPYANQYLSRFKDNGSPREY